MKKATLKGGVKNRSFGFFLDEKRGNNPMFPNFPVSLALLPP
jgi:hypothetical protein